MHTQQQPKGLQLPGLSLGKASCLGEVSIQQCPPNSWSLELTEGVSTPSLRRMSLPSRAVVLKHPGSLRYFSGRRQHYHPCGGLPFSSATLKNQGCCLAASATKGFQDHLIGWEPRAFLSDNYLEVPGLFMCHCPWDVICPSGFLPPLRSTSPLKWNVYSPNVAPWCPVQAAVGWTHELLI